MKAIQIVKPNELKVIDMDMPKIEQPDQVLVKMKAAGICGSDVGIYHGTNAAATYPRVIGHEMVGVIEAVGSGVTNRKVGTGSSSTRSLPAATATPAARAAPMSAATCRSGASIWTAATGSTWWCLRRTATCCPTS